MNIRLTRTAQLIAIAGMLFLPRTGSADQPFNNGEYAIHEDGGILYNPLSREARRKGLLQKFDAVPKKSGSIDMGDVTLRYEVPLEAEAYDVVPVKYALENRTPEPARPIAVECIAFEEKARTGGHPLYDMSLPGDLSVTIEYLGHVSADRLASRSLLDPRNPKLHVDDGVPWKSDPRVRSGEIRKADYQWFTFRYTVTGNTIFDPEGFNGIQAEMNVLRKMPDGSYKHVCSGINHWERPVTYQYPGESCEQTIMPRNHGAAMPPGEYKLRYSLVRKDYAKWNQTKNYSGGESFARLEVSLKVVDGNPQTVEPVVKQTLAPSAKSGDFPEFMHSFEEFLTGFEWFRNPVGKVESVVYVQVAPWTEQLNLKLIMGSPMALQSVSIPIAVSTEKVAVRYNRDNPFVLNRNGKQVPVIIGQLMPSMRHSIHFGADADRIAKDLLKEAQECGVNVYCSESGGWALSDFFRTPKKYDPAGELTKYFNLLLEPAGMPILGHGIYGAQGSYRLASKLMDPPVELGRGRELFSDHHTDPVWPQTWAAVALYNHKLLGSDWYKTGDGRTIIEMEDTVGWLRESIQIRYSLGEKGLRDFQQWVRTKYGTIEKVNKAWSSSFKDFAEIDPEENQSVAPLGYKWEYYKKSNPVFYDWSPAVEDLDIFRTEARCESYRQILGIVRKTIPGAVIDLRTEGGNFIIPDSSQLGDSPHERNVKYSARRNAMVGEVMAKNRDVISFYSDYTPLPYTPDEWRKLTRLSVEQGIRPMPLPHLARTRDIVLQQKWGNDYTVHYNLPHPAKGALVFGLQALFPVMQAVYEEGGCPGVIWADYTCDVFLTETQKRELKILRKALDSIAQPIEADTSPR